MAKTKQNLPKWFDGQLYDKGGIVKNPYSGEEYELTATELSMYDFIKGAEMVLSAGWYVDSNIHGQFQQGLDWFRKNNAKAYMALLD